MLITFCSGELPAPTDWHEARPLPCVTANSPPNAMEIRGLLMGRLRLGGRQVAPLLSLCALALLAPSLPLPAVHGRHHELNNGASIGAHQLGSAVGGGLSSSQSGGSLGPLASASLSGAAAVGGTGGGSSMSSAEEDVSRIALSKDAGRLDGARNLPARANGGDFDRLLLLLAPFLFLYSVSSTHLSFRHSVPMRGGGYERQPIRLPAFYFPLIPLTQTLSLSLSLPLSLSMSFLFHLCGFMAPQFSF
uniref:Uncharacterized protein n=1 Tax=Anopheles atroparvus TaxID=41427 RepID=A0A182IVD1_ANOAO